MEQIQKIYIDDVINVLDEREQNIVKLYYYAGFSEVEIAEAFNLSTPRVNQIKKRALEKCRQQLEESKKKLCASIA